MGTNYYWRPLITEEEREKLLEKTKNVKTLQEIEDFICCDLLNKEVRIGNSADGWKFLFYLGIRKHIYGQSLKREDIDQWLRSGIIVDEYGTEISVDDFWALVDSKKDDMDYNEYYKHELYSSHCWHGYDQYIDGLRFTCDESQLPPT